MKKNFKIGERAIGPGEPVFVIAEVGSNHDGSIETAKKLIKASKEAGADAVKFQSFTAEGLLNPLKPDDDSLRTWSVDPSYEVIEKLALPEEWHLELKEYAETLGAIFLSAPFDAGRAGLLNDLGIEAFKMASSELNNEPLLKLVASYKKPMIISTGFSTLAEVERAVEVVSGAGNDEVALLHCVGLYPPVYGDANIRAMVTMEEAFALPVGYSDHAAGSLVPLGAVALGASVIEKHITFSRELPGPDHPYAMEVEEFAEMVRSIRELSAALGDGIKRPLEGEAGSIKYGRRSLYAAIDIVAGTEITEEMIKAVRAAHGMEPARLTSVIGKKAKRDISAHELLKEEMIEK